MDNSPLANGLIRQYNSLQYSVNGIEPRGGGSRF